MNISEDQRYDAAKLGALFDKEHLLLANFIAQQHTLDTINIMRTLDPADKKDSTLFKEIDAEIEFRKQFTVVPYEDTVPHLLAECYAQNKYDFANLEKHLVCAYATLPTNLNALSASLGAKCASLSENVGIERAITKENNQDAEVTVFDIHDDFLRPISGILRNTKYIDLKDSSAIDGLTRNIQDPRKKEYTSNIFSIAQADLIEHNNFYDRRITI